MLRSCVLLSCLVSAALITPAFGDRAKSPNIVLILTDDHGWSQAHYEAGHYVEKKVPGTKMIYIDKVNPADRAGVTIPQLVDDMVEKGASLIIANSDDMKDGTREAALMHPDIKFLHVSGDDVLTGKGSKNLSNVMGRMEFGKIITAGVCLRIAVNPRCRGNGCSGYAIRSAEIGQSVGWWPTYRLVKLHG